MWQCLSTASHTFVCTQLCPKQQLSYLCPLAKSECLDLSNVHQGLLVHLCSILDSIFLGQLNMLATSDLSSPTSRSDNLRHTDSALVTMSTTGIFVGATTKLTPLASTDSSGSLSILCEQFLIHLLIHSDAKLLLDFRESSSVFLPNNRENLPKVSNSLMKVVVRATENSRYASFMCCY